MKQQIIFDNNVKECEAIFPDGSKINWDNTKAGCMIMSILLPTKFIKSSSQESDLETSIKILYENKPGAQVDEKDIPEDVLARSVTDLPIPSGKSGLRFRIHGIMRGANIETVGDLLKHKDDMFQFRNCGRKSVMAIKTALAEWGYDVDFRLKY